VVLALSGACGGSVSAVDSDAGADATTTTPVSVDAAGTLVPSETGTDVGISSSSSSGGDSLVFRDSGSDTQLDAGNGAPTDACLRFLPTIDAAPERSAPDAPAPLSCAFAPSDLAYNTAADCVVVALTGCGCWALAIGANKTNTYNCPPPPCPPFGPCGADSGLVAQDCQLAPSGAGLSVVCIDDRCSTYVATDDAGVSD
jgi:hypothetical protein